MVPPSVPVVPLPPARRPRTDPVVVPSGFCASMTAPTWPVFAFTVINPAFVDTPVIAESAPWIVILAVVKSPVLLTRNGAADAVVFPAKNGNVPGRSPTADDPVPAVREVELRVNPPIVPADAEIEPVLVTLNGAADPAVAPSQSL